MYAKSPLFSGSVRLLQEVYRVDGWVILSAKYGVLSPEALIEPYDLTLGALSPLQRSQWATAVSQELRRRFPFQSFVALVGGHYSKGLEGLPVEFPWRGLGGIGHILKWTKERLE